MTNRKGSQAQRALGGIVTSVVFGLVCLVGPMSVAAQAYEGADYCAPCHEDKYNDWRVSGHPWKLTKSEVARNRPLPLPEGYSWDDISYVIGGYKWKSRYMDRDGFIITSVLTDEGLVDGMNQYNMMTNRWVDYHPGEDRPYNCGRCHTTGYSPEGNQDDLPGIIGTWAFGGIQCEACHGPRGHGMPVDRSAELCGQCHIRGNANTIPARGGFIRHHEQYNEHLASPHTDLECADCHNPHKKAEFSIVRSCEGCHEDVAASYAGTTMDLRGVACEDCHMPMASKSAEALGPYEGDVRTHLFRINVKKNGQMFTDDGNFVLLDGQGQGAVTLDFACKRCHQDDGMNWLAGKAKKFHQRGRN